MFNNLQEKVRDLMPEFIAKRKFTPEIHVIRENALSFTIKLVANFLWTLFQLINIPLFIGVLFATGDFLIKFFTLDTYTLFDAEFQKYGMWILYGIVTYFILIQIGAKTRSNMISKELNLIWAVNFFRRGKVKNRFYSIELAEKDFLTLESYMEHQMREQIELREKELKNNIDSLKNTIQRLSVTKAFPSDVLNSFIRINQLFVSSLMEPDSSRHKFEIIMDQIVSEIANMRFFNGQIIQGSIMLEDNHELSIIGQYHLNRVKRKPVKRGEKFAGKVIDQAEMIIIPDIYSKDAEKYGYGPTTDKHKMYQGIMGMPIRELGDDTYKNIGVINLHLADSFYSMLTIGEKEEITAILRVYAQYIVVFKKLKDSGKMSI
ncbi:hypothetical protein BKP35_16585 [Anaerobacillus arseniciselenatis]|uniref:GAF domain-containing protein n=1 Tax=Anaerobacillus arseniciselenatis TaxID=85682 RepID=A0A1S2LAQ5_9BACI|nr:hypothetical protein [Anaerobacillus arseniciselenatis]OIJ09471.1 hypothetical protein BKP35_16585 [Anaerobacillus arseniciselenatis]